MNTTSRKWTDEVVDKLKSLINDKKSAYDCAIDLGFTVSAVRTKAYELRLNFKSKRKASIGSYQSNWSISDIETLRVKFDEGWTAIAIGQLLNKSESNIYAKMRELGLHSPRSIMTIQTLEAKRSGKSICRHCNQSKSIDEFNRRGKLGTGYLKSVCKSCEREISLTRYRTKDYYTIEETIQDRVRQAKYRANRKNIPFTITYDDILKIYHGQGGKCFYSGVEMARVPTKNNWTNISIDRVVPDLGYTKDNVVLCCDSVNTMKNAMPTETFIEICRKIVSYQERKI